MTDITDEMVWKAYNARQAKMNDGSPVTIGYMQRSGLMEIERAALETVAPMIREQGREQAAKILDKIADRHWKPVRISRSDAEVEHDDARRETTIENAAAIRSFQE